MDEDERIIARFEAIAEDLEVFINQKLNQNLIFALLKIKKASYRHRSGSSIDSRDSQSHFNSSSKRSNASIGAISQTKSRHSNMSYDLVKGPEALNEIRKKATHENIYSRSKLAMDSMDECLSENQKRHIHSANKRPSHSHSKSKEAKVPKLVGLVSSEEISDIEPPASQSISRQRPVYPRGYEQSIIEEDEDDDEFEDIILNRLDMIEDKVNRMLEAKKTVQNPNVASNPLIVRSKLSSSRGAGLNRVRHGNKNTSSGQILLRPEDREQVKFIVPNNRTVMVTSPRNREQQHFNQSKLHNEKKSFRANYTERLNNIAKKVQDAAERQQRATQLRNTPKYGVHTPITKYGGERRGHVNQFERPMAHYENVGSYQLNQDGTIPPHSIEQLPIHRISEADSEKGQDSYTFEQRQSKGVKYIPMSKLKHNSSNQTERKNATEKAKQEHYRLLERGQKDSYNARHLKQQNIKPRNFQVSYDQGLNQRKVFHRSTNLQSNFHKGSFQVPIKQAEGESPLESSNVKAYTDHGDGIDDNEGFSIHSDQNAYSESNRLRKITERYGYRNEHPEPLSFKNNPIEYRYHQKTERLKYEGSNRPEISQKEVYQYGQSDGQSDLNPKGAQVRYIDARESFQQLPRHQEFAENNRNPHTSINEASREIAKRQGYEGESEHKRTYSIYENDGRSKKFSTSSVNSFKSIPYQQTGGGRQVQYVYVRRN